jgi:hypothetical protein
MMKSWKREIIAALSISAIAIAIAVAWGSPFIGSNPARAQEPQQLKQLLQANPLLTKPHPGIVSRWSH